MTTNSTFTSLLASQFHSCKKFLSSNDKLNAFRQSNEAPHYLSPDLFHLLVQLPKRHKPDKGLTSLWQKDDNGLCIPKIDLKLFFERLFGSHGMSADNFKDCMSNYDSDQWRRGCEQLVNLISELHMTRTLQSASWSNTFSELPLKSSSANSDEEKSSISAHNEFVDEMKKVWQLSLSEWHQKRRPMSAFILFIPYFERLIQQIVHARKKFIRKHKRLDIPKLSDLIRDRDFHDIFGMEMGLLLSMMTKIQGLSLRNITLHGYMREEQWYEGFTTFLFALTTNITEDRISQLRLEAEHQSLPFFLDRKFDFDFQNDATLDSVTNIGYLSPNEMNESEIQSCRTTFTRSMFVLPDDEHNWEYVLKCYSEKEYFVCAMHVIPLIEHGLRRIYVHCNKCESKLLLANQDSLLTTIDITLAQTMIFESSKRLNRIHEELGILYQNALFDVFLWDKCVKYRDALCHGGAPATLSPCVARYLLILGLALCSQFDPLRHIVEEEQYLRILPISISRARIYFEREYEPIYHCMTILDRHLADAQKGERECFQRFTQLVSAIVSPVHEHDDLPQQGKLTAQALRDIAQQESWSSLHKNCHRLNDYLQQLDKQLKRQQSFTAVVSPDFIQVHGRTLYSTQLSDSSVKATFRMIEIYSHLQEIPKELERIYNDLVSKIEQRKASTKKKESFLICLFTAKSLLIFSKMIQDIVHHQHHHHLNEKGVEEAKKEWQLMTLIFNATCSIASHLAAGKVLSALETVVAFTVNPSEMKTVLPEFTFKTLKKKVSTKLYTNLI
uniref:DUF4209 domain-containing protein n=1 Tax=Percolomonas cosmopolitus TaxID=63605 RepID=A0A7S1KUJ0_9EUKA|mmetsp:Transcript_9994/g.37283  ORF Transcript_9994/g.37283 Transcript_9994/m.37283 type:complete len:785 (+) Transcript_9994:1-2355(+)